jgi:hypothetical protein
MNIYQSINHHKAKIFLSTGTNGIKHVSTQSQSINYNVAGILEQISFEQLLYWLDVQKIFFGVESVCPSRGPELALRMSATPKAASAAAASPPHAAAAPNVGRLTIAY